MSNSTLREREQLELFVADPDEGLFPYWRDELREWVDTTWHFRHHRNCTGWSSAEQGYEVAYDLFRHGQMTRSEFRRWYRFNARIRRWSGLPRQRPLMMRRFYAEHA